MQRLRLSDVRESVAKAVQVNSTNTAAIAEYVNLASERLLYKGKWVGTYGRYRVCINANCITLPRELETIEAAAICRTPAKIRSEWFEFLDAGPGILQDTDDIGKQLVDRGEACCYDDPIGTTNKLAVWTDKNENATVNLQFYDINGKWVRSSWQGEWIDGENISVPNKGTFYQTTRYVATNGFVRFSKPVTNGYVYVFSYNVETNLYKPLAMYAPDETVPVYRRYLVPGNSLRSQNEDCVEQTLDITGKMRFLEVRRDEDYLMVSHRGALILMVQAVKKEQDNLWKDARRYEDQAYKCLDDQLAHYKGDGEVQPITFTSSEIAGAAVENLI